MPVSGQFVRVIDVGVEGEELAIIEGDGIARTHLSAANGAQFRSFQTILLQNGAATIPLSHSSDSVYYVVDGEGEVLDIASGETQDLVTGSMVHIDAGDRYSLRASATSTLNIVGGPCPPDRDLDAYLTNQGTA